MIREGRFGVFEAVTLILWPALAKIYLSYSSIIIQENCSGAWIAVIIGCITACLWFLPLAALFKRFPGEDLAGIAETAAGPVIGKLLTGIVVGYFFISTALVLRQIAETVIGTALPQIPLLAITVTFTLVMVLPSYWGLESSARFAALVTPFLLAGGVGLFLLQFKNMSMNNLAPLWGPGLKQLAVNGLSRSSLLSELVFLGFLAPFIPRKKTVRAGVYLVAAASVLLVGAMLVTQTIFPPQAAAENTFPFYEIGRSIYFGRFYQRVEFIFVVVWITIVLLSLVVRFYFTTVGLARIFGMPYHQPLIGMVALAVLAVALLFPNYNTVIYFDNLIQGHWSWVPAFLVPFIVYLTALILRKQGNPSEKRVKCK
ncbi:MAG: spore germination protein [Firmicutes bacterium]|nr:spore germination protein [Bacillota bacterium]